MIICNTRNKGNCCFPFRKKKKKPQAEAHDIGYCFTITACTHVFVLGLAHVCTLAAMHPIISILLSTNYEIQMC